MDGIDTTADVIAQTRAQGVQAAEAEQAREAFHKRRQPILALWKTLYASRPQDDAQTGTWLKGWSKRLAKLGKAITAGEYADNVTSRSGTGDLAERQALEVLKTSLSGDAAAILELLRKFTIGHPSNMVEWHRQFETEMHLPWVWHAPAPVEVAPPAEPVQEIVTATGKAKVQPKAPRPNYNALMISTLQKNPDAREWTARKWQFVLGCSTSTVHSQPTWKELQIQSEAAKIARQMKAGDILKKKRPKPNRHDE